MATMQYETGLPGAVATPELVGRKEILDLVQRYLNQAGQGPQFLFLTGEGGIGKTRLLFALLKKFAEEDNDFLTASQIVDLYDIPNHTPEELIETIRRESRFPRESFKSYEKEFGQLERMRLAGGVQGISEQRQKLYRTFLDDLRALSDSQRVIIALDTAERLVYFPDLKGESELASSWRWLVENIDRLGNVTFLVAGRKATKFLMQTLEGTAASKEEIAVGPFSEQESMDYFAAVLDACLRLDEIGTARKIQNLTPNNRLIAHLLSGGRPILLSLLVDYLIPANRLDLPLAMQTTVQDVMRMPEEERKTIREEFETQLIAYLIENSGYGDEILAIGRASKGIDCRLLSKILQVDETQAEVILEDMHKFSFIKVRAGGRYFFHDELYEMLKRHVYSKPLDIEGKVRAAEAIRLDYKDRYWESVQELNRLCAPVEIEGSTAWLKLDEITKIYNGRRALLVEMTYYRLRDEPLAGFQYYYRYMREALEAHDLTFFLMLQAELTSYLGEPETHRQLERYHMDREFLHSELLLYPVKHAWIEHDYTGLIAECDRLLEAGSLVPQMRESARVWKARAKIYRADAEQGDIAGAMDILDDIIQRLPQTLPTESLQVDERTQITHWYSYAVLATAYRARAYLYWIEGNLKNSIEDYQNSAPLWRLINLDVELAATLNDLGFAIAENGDPSEASQIIQDAFEMRRNIGPRMPVSLSLNTLGIIRMREGAYAEAIQFSERALALARALNDWRTICLAQTAISEARRRKTFVDPLLNQDQKVNELREARDAAHEAYNIAKGNERIRMVEALIEWGCACRDWVRIRVEYPSPRDNIEGLILESQEKLEEAAQLAGEDSLLYRKVDALVNLAWLWFYSHKFEKLGSAMKTARDAIPNKFFLVPGQGRPVITEGDVLVQVWTQLGKLEILEGNQKFSEYLNGGTVPETKSTNALCEAALHYSMGLEYDSLYSKNHPGFQQAKAQIYERLKKMRTNQLRLITQQVKEFEKTYTIQNSAMKLFMKQWALWFEA